MEVFDVILLCTSIFDFACLSKNLEKKPITIVVNPNDILNRATEKKIKLKI
jgi:hypothetical protein